MASFKALVVFRNLVHPALIRTVHVYRLREGEEEEVEEREYVFHKDSDYEEIGFCKVLTLQTFRLSAQFKGLVNGVWLCIYVFDADRHCSPDLDTIPTILSISRNPKLASIPTLANDLHIISQLSSRVGNRQPLQIKTKETSEGNGDNDHQSKVRHLYGLDLNSLPYSESENEENDERAADRLLSSTGCEVILVIENHSILAGFIKSKDKKIRLPRRLLSTSHITAYFIAVTTGVIEKKKKRAATKDIARLALEDLTKYFDLPIVEASKNLKVGLTVLKKKCREFGIPRWPHRKIKSLDSLIQDLQEEVERQHEEDEAAAMVVAKRQRMIESEKESIERKPFMEIQRETKKFRQDIFKKRHRARVLENQCRTLSLF